MRFITSCGPSPLTPDENKWVNEAKDGIQGNISKDQIGAVRSGAEKYELSGKAIKILLQKVKTEKEKVIDYIPPNALSNNLGVLVSELNLLSRLEGGVDLSSLFKNEEDRVKIAEILSKTEPERCVVIFNKLGITNENSRSKIAMYLAKRLPFEEGIKLLSFVQEEKSRANIAVVLAERFPARCVKQFSKFELTNKAYILEFVKVIAKVAPGYCAASIHQIASNANTKFEDKEINEVVQIMAESNLEDFFSQHTLLLYKATLSLDGLKIIAKKHPLFFAQNFFPLCTVFGVNKPDVRNEIRSAILEVRPDLSLPATPTITPPGTPTNE